jgi:hypothetical protein
MTGACANERRDSKSLMHRPGVRKGTPGGRLYVDVRRRCIVERTQGRAKRSRLVVVSSAWRDLGSVALQLDDLLFCGLSNDRFAAVIDVIGGQELQTFFGGGKGEVGLPTSEVAIGEAVTRVR